MKGTPIFVAITVVLGKIIEEDDDQNRKNLPRMKLATKEWYIKTYGQERYDRYWSAMEKVDKSRTYDPEKHSYGHRAFHDAESFAWVIVNELMKAWPDGSDEDLTDTACKHINILEGHNFGVDTDSRMPMRFLDLPSWERILHPRLALLAPLVHKLVKYFSVEWLLWPELPEDHGHEAVKVLLREAILDMNEKSDPIPLKPELRCPRKYAAAQQALHYSAL